MSVFTNPASSSKEDAKAYTAAILGLLGDRNPMHVLQRTETALQKLVEGLSGQQLSKREAPKKWSVKHVIQHLADSEVVLAWRLRMVLAHDRPALTGYDQDLWAERLGYGDIHTKEALSTFAALRKSNIRLMKRASREDLQRVGVHAERGDESVAHMMRLYAGHDLLHLRQIDRILGLNQAIASKGKASMSRESRR